MGHMDVRKKMPAEAVELYSQFIHGEIGRRDFMNGLKRYAIGGLTVTAMYEALMPNYALGQQVRKDDERIKASYETIPSPNGHGTIRGYFVRPFSADSRAETGAKLPGILVIHENRGLNPHTEDVARRFALANFNAFAPDCLTSVGGYPGDDFRGGQAFAKLDARQEDPGSARFGALAEGACGRQRQSRRHRLLLRRRHVQCARRHDGRRTGGGSTVLRRPDAGGKRAEDQGRDPDPPRRAR